MTNMKDENSPKKKVFQRLLGGLIVGSTIVGASTPLVKNAHNMHLDQVNGVRREVLTQNLGRRELPTPASASMTGEINRDQSNSGVPMNRLYRDHEVDARENVSRQVALRLVNKFIEDKNSLEKDDLLVLEREVERFSSIGLPEAEDLSDEEKEELKEEIKARKDIEYVKNRTLVHLSMNILRMRLSSFIQSSTIGPDLFLKNVRNPEISIRRDANQISVDYWHINSNFLLDVMRNADRYGVSLRLVIEILTIENNFGLNKHNASGARGPAQTKESIARHYIEGYDNMDENNRNYAHFLSMFAFLKDLKDRLGLDIGSQSTNRVDMLAALLIYHDGETAVFRRKGELPKENTEGRQYLDKGLSARNIKFLVPATIANNNISSKFTPI